MENILFIFTVLGNIHVLLGTIVLVTLVLSLVLRPWKIKNRKNDNLDYFWFFILSIFFSSTTLFIYSFTKEGVIEWYVYVATFIAWTLILISVIIFIIADADGDRNLFFASAHEGKAMMITQGGIPKGYIAKYSGHNIDPRDRCITKDPDNPGELLPSVYLFKRYWKGIPGVNTIYRYRMGWQEWKTDKETKIQVLETRSELTKFVILRPFPYGVFVDDAKDIDLIPLEISLTVTWECVNMDIPFVGTEDYQTLGRLIIATKVRNFTGTTSYEFLRSEEDTDEQSTVEQELDAIGKASTTNTVNTSKKRRKRNKTVHLTKKKEELSKEVLSLNNSASLSGNTGTFADFTGFVIVSVEVHDIDIAGSQRAALETAYSEFKAQKVNSKTNLLKAKTEKAERILKGQGEAQYIEDTGGATNKVLEAKYATKTKDGNAVVVSLAEGIAEHKGPLSIDAAEIIKTFPLTEENK